MLDKEELLATIKKYRRLDNQVKNLEQDRGILRRRLLDEMDERQLHELRVGKYRVYVTEIYTMRLDAQRLREEQRALAERYTLCVPSKRLTVS